MAGYDPNQPRDEIGRWAKVGGRGKHTGKRGKVTAKSPSGKYFTLEDQHGNPIGYFHGSDLSFEEMDEINEEDTMLQAAENAAGISAEGDLKKFGIKPFKDNQPGRNYSQFTKEDTNALTEVLANKGWTQHDSTSYPLKNKYFFNQGGKILTKKDVTLTIEPFKDLFKLFYEKKR